MKTHRVSRTIHSLPLLVGWVIGGVSAFGADDSTALFSIRQNGKFGYIDATGKIVISPRFLMDHSHEGARFSEGLQAVSIGDKCGFIDPAGSLVIEPTFDQAGAFAEGLAAVRVADAPHKWGYIDKIGQMIISPQFDEALAFSDGLASVVVGGKMGYIDKSGEFVVRPQYRSYSPTSSTFAEGLACVGINEKWGFIDTHGVLVIEARFNGPSSFRDGLAAVQVGEKFSTRWGFINKNGSFAIEPQFRLAWPFSEGLARVEVDGGSMAFIDKNGKVVFTVPNGRWAGEFSEGIVNVEASARSGKEQWGYIDRTGTWLIEPRFQRAEPFSQGLARVAVDNKLAYIDHAGHYVWGPDSGNEALAANLRKQATPEEWRKNQDELLHLAELIDAKNPPLTSQMLESGAVPAKELQTLASGGSENARLLLERLLSFTPNPALVKMSPDLAGMQQHEVQAQVARALVEIGDPFVLSTLRTWLSDALKVDGEMDVYMRTTVGAAVEGLKQFRDKSSLVPLEALARSAGIDRWMREEALAAIASLGLPAARPTLLEALKDEQLSEHIRCAIAAALVRIGDGAGREFLLDTYDLYLESLRRRSSDHGISRGELEFLGDPELIKTLESKAKKEPPGVPKNNINTLLDVMRVSAMPAEQLMAVASNGGEDNLNLRLHAIRFMGTHSGPDALSFLQTIRDGPDDYSRDDWNEMKRSATDSAIRSIRMRNSLTSK